MRLSKNSSLATNLINAHGSPQENTENPLALKTARIWDRPSFLPGFGQRLPRIAVAPTMTHKDTLKLTLV